MKPLVTVLYEDSKLGKEYPLHRLVLRMVEDDINGQTWRLLQNVTDNPKKGIDNLLGDVRIASLTAGRGFLFVLADRDVLVEHINKNARPGEPRLAATATDDQIAEAVRATSDAPEKVRVFLLLQNLEGLIQSIESCGPPAIWAADLARAKAKDRIARNLVLRDTVKEPMRGLRACIRKQQPGLDALVGALREVLPAEAIA